MKRYVQSSTVFDRDYNKYLDTYYEVLAHLQRDFPECVVTESMKYNQDDFVYYLDSKYEPTFGSYHIAYRGSGGVCIAKDIRDYESVYASAQDVIDRIDAELASYSSMNSTDYYVDSWVKKHTSYSDFDDYYSSMSEYLIPGDRLVEWLQSEYTGDAKEIRKFCKKLIYGFNYDELQESGLADSKAFMKTLLDAMINDVTEYADDQGYPWSDED